MFMKDSLVINLIQKRTDKGVTQEQLAGVLGVTRQTIISIERGRYKPSLVLALKIAKYFKSSVEDIFRLQ
jgi:putative transcriptional regulator